YDGARRCKIASYTTSSCQPPTSRRVAWGNGLNPTVHPQQSLQESDPPVATRTGNMQKRGDMRTTRTRVAIACAAVWFLAFAPEPVAAQRGAVTGTVRDAATQEPLVGAQIQVSGTQLGGLTDQRGQYLIPNVPAGERAIIVTIIGYGQAS